jgi:hypothetical protein
MSFNTTSTLIILHFELNDFFLFFFKDYELDEDLKFLFNYFKLAFQRMPQLFTNDGFRMN